MADYAALTNNIKWSEAAYKIYPEYPNYHHTLHVFYTNERIYACLNDLLEIESLIKELRMNMFAYLFHLEDWFLQFSVLEEEVIDIEGQFIFDSLKTIYLILLIL